MKRLISIITALLLVAQLPLSALAVEFDLSVDSVSVDDTHAQYVSDDESRQEHGGSVTITQSNSETPTSNTVTVTTTSNDVTVTLDNVNIDVSNTGSAQSRGEAAVSVERAEDTTVTVELKGTNELSSGSLRGGLEVSGEGNLIIQDADDDGALNATGGLGGAGIGSGLIIDTENQTFVSDGKNITITGGTINAEGGSNAAGIGGAIQGDGSNIVISGGSVKAEGGDFGAGIGGGSTGDGNNIIIRDGNVEAQGGDHGAGIGGGYSDPQNGQTANGTNITIENGTVVANGGSHGAGIGGGNRGNGNDITITGGSVTVNGGDGGAGIGGGYDADGTSIAISGGEVTATGDHAAGIGGGYGSKGENITISGGTVAATGGLNSAGIGGGAYGESADIVLKEDANVTATSSGNAADIGNGSVIGSQEKQENKVDISELNPEGSFTGSDGEKIEGEYVPVVPAPTPAEPEVAPVEEGEEETAPVSYPAAVEEEEPIFDIFKNGETEMEGTEEVKGDVLYVEAKAGHAAFTVKLSQLKALAAKGIETVVFITENGAAAYSLDALLEALEGAEDLTVTIDGETVTLHYGDQEKTELLLDKETVDKLVEAR